LSQVLGLEGYEMSESVSILTAASVSSYCPRLS
jgi:hypothetical protein